MLHAGQDRRTGMPLLSSAVQASPTAGARAVRARIYWRPSMPLPLCAVHASFNRTLELCTLPSRKVVMFMLWSTVQAGDFTLLAMQLCCIAEVIPLLFSAVQGSVRVALTYRLLPAWGNSTSHSPADAQCIKVWLTWPPCGAGAGQHPLVLAAAGDNQAEARHPAAAL